MTAHQALFAILLLVVGCHKPTTHLLTHEIIPSGTDEALFDLAIVHDSLAYICGGNMWQSGIVLKSTDHCQSWTKDSVSNHRLFCLAANEQQVFSAGVRDKLYALQSDDRWQETSIPRHSMVKAATMIDSQLILLASGVAFQHGRVHQFDTEHQTYTVDTFDAELLDVAVFDDQHWVVCGYGMVASTADSGMSWHINNITGDFYTAISVVSHQEAFVVGYYGSLWHTIDAGSSWSVVNTKTSISGINTLYFLDSKNGWAAGDEGHLWSTRDGGIHWMQALGLPDNDIQKLVIYNDKGYYVGSDGLVVTFDSQ